MSIWVREKMELKERWKQWQTCAHNYGATFFIGKILFLKKINHQKFKNQVLLEVFGRHKFENKNKIIKLLY